MTKLEPPEGLRELLENAKGRTWINGRSPRMGEGVCLRLTDEDLEYLTQLVNAKENLLWASAAALSVCCGVIAAFTAACIWLVSVFR